MKWLRFKHAGTMGFGVLKDDKVAVHAGDMFGDNQATGETLDVAAIEWLTPSVPFRPNRSTCSRAPTPIARTGNR
jgi:hypothetical protein